MGLLGKAQMVTLSLLLCLSATAEFDLRHLDLEPRDAVSSIDTDSLKTYSGFDIIGGGVNALSATMGFIAVIGQLGYLDGWIAGAGLIGLAGTCLTLVSSALAVREAQSAQLADGIDIERIQKGFDAALVGSAVGFIADAVALTMGLSKWRYHDFLVPFSFLTSALSGIATVVGSSIGLNEIL